MTRTTKPTSPVRPSNADPVDAWLDVLVTMLAIPKPDRQRVRDELEDHLRSRIDDLLIHGMTEPQALQKAVAELGETADLARQLTHAHRPPRTRRFAMHGLIIALAGTLVALGFNNLSSTASSVSSTIVAVESQPALSRKLIPVRDRTIGEVLEAFRTQADRPVMIHWPLLTDIGLDRDTPIDLDTDALSMEMILKLLSERTEPSIQNSMELLDAGDVIEVGLRSQFDQRTMQRKTFDAARLIDYGVTSSSSRDVSGARSRSGSFSVSEGVRGVAMLLEEHISPDDWISKGGSLAQYSIIGSTIIVTAPERIQQEVAAMIGELTAIHKHSQMEAEAAARSRMQVLAKSYEGLESEYASLFMEWERIALETPGAAAERGQNIVTEFKMRDLSERMQSVRLRQASVRAIHEELVREWGISEQLSNSASLESPGGNPRVSGGVVHFFANDSDQSIPLTLGGGESIRISQILASQGYGDEDSASLYVYFQPAGTTKDKLYRTSVQQVLTVPKADRVVRAGDRVQVSSQLLP